MAETRHNFFDIPFLGRGFRPFFFLGAIYSVINLLIWGGFYAGYITPPDIMMDPISWHAHEMIYGFAIAIIAGFLLTAVANWTGGAPARQLHLLGLCILWVMGRMVMNVNLGLPDVTILIVESLFLPALAISLAIPLLKSWSKRNFIFLALLSALFACDMVFMVTEERTPLYIAVLIIITMISLVGGRVIPAFTVGALRQRGINAFQTDQRKLDVLALLSIMSIIFTFIFIGIEGYVLATISFVSVIIHALRMYRYHTLKILNDPMVWILHAGYLWVIIGLFLLGMSAINLIDFSYALHAFTAGAIGSMTLGMMSRVALGHTGRDLIASKMVIVSFVLIQIAAILRVFVPMIFPHEMSLFIMVSAFLWSLCFTVYLMVFTKILWSKRPDGKMV